MAFDTYEEALETSRPVEVYTFQLGSEFFRYTSAEASVTLGAITFEPLAIKRGGMVEGPEERSSVFTIEMPTAGTIASRYISIVPGPQCLVEVIRYQRLDTPTPEQIIIFQGAIQSVSFKEDGRVASIACQSLVAATSRPAPRFVYSSACNHVLYDSRCKIVRDQPAFKFSGTVNGINGNVLTIVGLAAFGNGWFTSGLIEAFSGTDARMILEHTGDDITLLLPFPSPVVGTSVEVFAGCNHATTDCDAKFDNIINYGGFPFVPRLNPFESGI